MGCSPSRLPGESSQNLPLMPGCFMATYQIQPDYVFSEELHVYGEDKDKMARLPAPHPPTRTKDEIFDPNLFTKLDRRADKAPAKLLKEHYSSLMHYLLDGVKDPLGKVRVIYRWITAQNVDKILIPKNPPEVTTPLHQVWKIRNKKGNYAQLVSIMCRLAGVPCVIVHGKLKGSTYEVGSPVDEKTHYGEWNAVLIDEDWWLLNAYWGACALGSNGDDDWVEVETGEEVKADGERPATTNGRQSKAEKEFMYVCDENYFLAEPKQMVSTHLPTVEAWQLLNEPVSSDRFQTMAFLKDRFFNLRMSVISHPDCIITSHSGDVELLFGLPEEDSLFLKYYFLLFRLDNRKPGEAAPKYDRYVFLHKKRPDLLSVRVRTPVPGTFRLELVGKDTRTKTPQYDYDWVCLYKLHFEFAADKCLPFPETPMLGWGPGMPTLELGLAPLNHLSGLVPAGNNGETRLSFMVRDPDVVSQLQFSAMLVKGGVREQLCRDRVVHRLEHGQLIFNVSTPKPGEYRIALNAARKDNPDQVENFCNYLITSDQKERRAAYPRGFEGALGQKPACSRLGIIPLSHHSGMIYTETGEVQISFKLTQPVDVTLSIVGNDIMISDSKRLVHETMEDHVVTYVVRLPTNGNFGLRVIGKAKDGGLFESVYDYVIQYPKTRGNRRPEENSTGTLRALPPRREEAVVKAVSEEIPGVVPDSPKDELPPPTMAALSSPTPLNTPAMDGEDGQVQELEKYVEVAAATQDRSELERALSELKKINSDKANNVIALANRELDIMNVRTEMKEATEARNLKRLLKAISLAKEKGYERLLKEELRDATTLKDRLAHIQKLLHDVLDLDSKTFAEIRGYSKPPPAVHAVMQGALLLLGHFDEETQDWSKVQASLGKTGKDNVKKRMERLDVDSVAVDVALGARQLLEGITLDQVRSVSAGAAAFYVWTKGVVDEVERHYGEEARSARPRTSKSRRARRHGREPSFVK